MSRISCAEARNRVRNGSWSTLSHGVDQRWSIPENQTANGSSCGSDFPALCRCRIDDTVMSNRQDLWNLI